jgi:uncharacterized C2H2 Zn-finger protein
MLEGRTSTGPDAYLICGTCNKTFKQRAYLMGHVDVTGHKPQVEDSPQTREVEPSKTNSYYNTPTAGSITSAAATQGSHETNPYLTCGTCDRSFKDRDSLMRHVNSQNHRPEVRIDNPRLTCLACHKRFKRRGDLFDHLETSGHARDLDTGEPEDLIDPYLTCIACHKTFERRRDLFHHIDTSGHARDVDTGEPDDARHSCLACRKTFEHRADLFEHLNISGHAEPEFVDLDHTCLGCYTTFERHKDLLAHFAYLDKSGRSRKLDARGLEVVDPDVSCLMCHKTFEYHESLLQHIKALGHARTM